MHAAGHQIAYQLWLASSLLSDSLAVAAQALMARALARGDTATARAVLWRCLALGLGLGLALAAGLAALRDPLASLFTRESAVLACMDALLPLVVSPPAARPFAARGQAAPPQLQGGTCQRPFCISLRPFPHTQFLTQPLNALAFVVDGILYGVSGYAHAARAMVTAALPAIAIMVGGTQWAGGVANSDGTLLAVWAGLAAFMAGRFLTIFVPLVRRQPPFDVLHEERR